MSKKKIAKSKPLSWKKISDWVCEIKDPITGGNWRYIARKETSDFQMFQAIAIYLSFYGEVRPKKGTYVCLSQPALD
jgi:hypothetical protein